MKSFLVILPVVMITAYTIAAYVAWGDYEELHFDVFYGNIFTVGASITLALAILGAVVFRQSVLIELRIANYKLKHGVFQIFTISFFYLNSQFRIHVTRNSNRT